METIKYFGHIRDLILIDALETECFFDGDNLKLDVNLDGGYPTYDWVTELNCYLNQLTQIKQKVVEAIHTDYDNNGVSKDLISFYMDDCDEEFQNELIAGTDVLLPIDERLLEAHVLRRIGFYPTDNHYAVWDFRLNPQLSDQILVVMTTEKGDVINVAWES